MKRKCNNLNKVEIISSVTKNATVYFKCRNGQRACARSL